MGWLEVSVLFLFILLILLELVLELILVNLKLNVNLMDLSIAAEKYLEKMELKDYIKDSKYLLWVFSPIEPSISGTYFLI